MRSILALLAALLLPATAGAVGLATHASVAILPETAVEATPGEDLAFTLAGEPDAGLQVTLAVRDARGEIVVRRSTDLALDADGQAVASFPPETGAEPREVTILVIHE